jgi:hypothetical protein
MVLLFAVRWLINDDVQLVVGHTITNMRKNQLYDNQIWISIWRLSYGAGFDSGRQCVRPDRLNM